MPKIKVIETEYRGYKFRSRTEARWAVFFDEIGVLWEYEKEGYDLGGIWYLPDFWIPDWSSFIEIKGDPMQLGDALEKCMKLKTMTGERCFVLYGIPDHETYQMIFPPTEHNGEIYDGIGNPYKILQCRRCPGHWCASVSGEAWGQLGNCSVECNSDRFPIESDELIKAHNTAKSYRF